MSSLARRLVFLQTAIELTQKAGRKSPPIAADSAARALLEVELAIAEVRRILDLEIPASPVVEASEDSLSDAPPEELENSLDDLNDAMESPRAEVTMTEPEMTQPAPASAPTDISALLSSLRISTNAEGGLHIEAPPGSASTMAALFETMARVLRESPDSTCS